MSEGYVGNSDNQHSMRPKKRRSLFQLLRFPRPKISDPELQNQKEAYRSWQQRTKGTEGNVLHYACSEGFLSLLNHSVQHLEAGEWMTAEDSIQRTPLEVAAVKKQQRCVDVLLQSTQQTSLHSFMKALNIAISANDLSTTRIMLASTLAKSNYDAINDPSRSECLTYDALHRRQYEVVLELLNFECEIVSAREGRKAMVPKDSTLLVQSLHAVLKNVLVSPLWKEIADLLVLKGALRGLEDWLFVRTLLSSLSEENTVALEYVLQSSERNLAKLDAASWETLRRRVMEMKQSQCTMQVLVNYGAKNGPPKPAKETSLFGAVATNNLHAVKLLLAQKTDTHAKNDKGITAYEVAVDLQNVDIIEAFIDHTPQLLSRVCSSDKQTLLMRAAKTGLLKSARCLLDAGALTDTTDKMGDTALHQAAENGHTDIVRVLLEAGADSGILNFSDLYPIHLAAKSRSTAAYQLLLEDDSTIIRGDYLSGLFVLSLGLKTGNEDILRSVLETFQVNVDAVELSPGCTPLFYAVRDCTEGIVELLLKHGANPNYCSNPSLPSILDIALCEGRGNIARLLLKYGASTSNRGLPTVRFK